MFNALAALMSRSTLSSLSLTLKELTSLKKVHVYDHQMSELPS
jgi:hypothetical protein